MALLTPNNQLSLLEVARRTDPDGKSADIVEVLTISNPMLQDVVWKEANGATYEKITRRASLPTGSWRQYNQGVATESSITITATETIGMLHGLSEVDEDEAKLNAAGVDAYRQSEAVAFLEGLSQTWGAALINADSSTSKEKFDGIIPRTSTVDSYVVWDNGGTAALTSIYGVIWGLSKVYCVYPRGSGTAGIEKVDNGRVRVLDSDSKPYFVLSTLFKLHCGLAVKDPRCLIRIANISTSSTTGAFDEDTLIKALNRSQLPSLDGLVLYANDAICTQAEIALKDKANVSWTTRDGAGLGGVPWLWFRGFPVRKVSRNIIGVAETQIS